MSTTFTLTPADFARFQKIIARRFKKKMGLLSFQFGLRVLVWGSVGFAVAAYARLLREFPEASEALILVAILLAIALFAIVLMPHMAQITFRKHMLHPNGAFLSPQTVAFSAAGLSVNSPTGSTLVPWQGVLSKDEDDANYYLFIDTLQALILPRSAVAAELEQFEQYTNHLTGAA